MEWSEKELEKGRDAFTGDANYGNEIGAVMTRAVELVAARGGTMTADDVANLRAKLEGAMQNEAKALEQGGRDQETIDALRARVAELERQVEKEREYADKIVKVERTRAMNEGLRKAVAWLQMRPHVGASVVEEIERMKEPES